MLSRVLLVLVALAGTGAYLHSADGPERPVAREPLSALPLALGDWQGHPAAPFADDVVAQLGVDDYIHRQYQRAGGAPVAVYAGYYDSQRQGDAIHSPQNCLPGAGWQPVESGRLAIGRGSGAPIVNRYVIARGADRQVVLYWYQGRNRVVANEYANKAFLMLDAARLHRTNGGLVRLISPVVTTTDAATRELAAFAGALLPRLPAYMP